MDKYVIVDTYEKDNQILMSWWTGAKWTTNSALAYKYDTPNITGLPSKTAQIVPLESEDIDNIDMGV